MDGDKDQGPFLGYENAREKPQSPTRLGKWLASFRSRMQPMTTRSTRAKGEDSEDLIPDPLFPEIDLYGYNYTLGQAALLDYLQQPSALVLKMKKEDQVRKGETTDVLEEIIKEIPKAFDRIDPNRIGNSVMMLNRIEQALFPIKVGIDQDRGEILPETLYASFTIEEAKLPALWDTVRNRQTQQYRQSIEGNLDPVLVTPFHKEMLLPLGALIDQIHHINPRVWGGYLSDPNINVHPLAVQISREIRYLRSLGINIDEQIMLYHERWSALQKKAHGISPSFSIHPPLSVL